MTCPSPSHRRSDGDPTFDTERAYGGVVEEFVSPMRADVCNDRHEFDHERDCGFYRDAASS